MTGPVHVHRDTLSVNRRDRRFKFEPRLEDFIWAAVSKRAIVRFILDA
jgi:hypothetical protein